MLRNNARRFHLAIVVLTLLAGPAEDIRAESGPIRATTIRESALRKVHLQRPVEVQRRPYRRQCNTRQRVLAGAVIGAVAGMIAMADRLKNTEAIMLIRERTQIRAPLVERLTKLPPDQPAFRLSSHRHRRVHRARNHRLIEPARRHLSAIRTIRS